MIFCAEAGDISAIWSFLHPVRTVSVSTQEGLVLRSLTKSLKYSLGTHDYVTTEMPLSDLCAFCSWLLPIVFAFSSTWILACGQTTKIIVIQHKGKGIVASPVFEGCALGIQMDISESVCTRSKTKRGEKQTCVEEPELFRQPFVW